MSDDALPWQPDDEEVVGYLLVWRFVDQSPAFVFGIEAGVIYEKMRRKETPITTSTHAANQEELLNLANSLGYSAAFEDVDDCWQRATFTRPG